MAVRKKKRVTRKTTRKKTITSKKSVASNQKAHWKTYRDLQKKVDRAWDKLQADVKRKASPNVLIRNKNQLLLLLGECNYMARECMRCASKSKKK